MCILLLYICITYIIIKVQFSTYKLYNVLYYITSRSTLAKLIKDSNAIWVGFDFADI
jgi:hypothetical protein